MPSYRHITVWFKPSYAEPHSIHCKRFCRVDLPGNIVGYKGRSGNDEANCPECLDLVKQRTLTKLLEPKE